ncbi:MAG TPA: hypothetical protein VK463_08300 [Desulfomonilaceae bacterium]|nr:hypothetical protein [Desulfomonilaceae bacterium]
MVSRTQAKQFISSVMKFGKTIDPEDTTVLYGWLYTSSIALQPFPTEYSRFCDRCLHSFDSPETRLRTGLKILKAAAEKVDSEERIRLDKVTGEYFKLLERVFQ